MSKGFYKNRRLKSFIFLSACFFIAFIPHAFNIENFFYIILTLSFVIVFYGLIVISRNVKRNNVVDIVSRRTFNLLDRIEFLEKEIYPKEKGYVRGVLAPTFTSKMDNPPTPLPEAVRGDALTISEISIGELKSAENWPMEFGDIFPIQQDVNDNYLVPGLRLFSKDRSLALSAWFSCLEPIKLVVNKNQLILEASEDDKWLVTDLPEKDANILNTKFLENKKNSFGYQFISIQSTPYIEKFAGFWILRDIELIS